MTKIVLNELRFSTCGALIRCYSKSNASLIAERLLE
jgi:hypothetical protein